VELFEVIRRGYAAGKTIQGLSKKHGVYRRIVRQALGNAIPPDRKAVAREAPRQARVAENAYKAPRAESGSRCSIPPLVSPGAQFQAMKAAGK